MAESIWQIAVDVGGTFCDVLARSPSGETHVHKLLSSGRVKGTAGAGSDPAMIIDPARRDDPEHFWDGWRCVLLDREGGVVHESRVQRFDVERGALWLEHEAAGGILPGATYELVGVDEAPIVGIRYAMGLRSGDPILPCAVRLGTTRATNALLERRGAQTALVITRGFGDLLEIGDQRRPRLFDLEIRKSQPLCARVVEVRERLDAAGDVVVALDRAEVVAQLSALRAEGIESVAICLMNAYRNPAHELAVAKLAREVGFMQVSVSTSLSASQGILARAENCVVDAYLGPSFRAYVDDVAAALPGDSLRLMTGSGGLVGVARFSGASSIMSGPAGGLVGAADVAGRTGFERVIAFDMGGTSTDVSRYAGSYEYQQETLTAGARIVMPVLAIETVAAGGGSVCAFDGIRFQVGPSSAGSDPGPASYGRGGPLTLTDVNFYLGRICADKFPFPLVRSAVDRQFDALADGVGRGVTRCDIAEGFLEIANASMAEAIRRITIERGYDAREHALVCFGGAGGQHACAVARRLEIETVVVPLRCGVLSAHGIAVADVKRIVERPVHRVYSAAVEAELAQSFLAMETETEQAIVAEGVSADRVRCARLLDVRYVGEGSFLTVEADDCIGRFERLHRLRFGYVHLDRDVEVVAARVEGIGEVDKPVISVVEAVERRADPVGNVTVVFAGRAMEASLYERESLRAGDRFDGPAIVTDATSTLVVEPGWRGQVVATGDVVLTDVGADAVAKVLDSTAADPVQLELFDRQFAAIAEQMGAALRRTAMSTNVKERLDYSCAVFNGLGDLIANAPHIPVHLGSMGACVKAVLEDVQNIDPLDVVVTNDPFRGGTHLPDVTVVSPVFVAGAITFFVASRAHHAEIGGVCPGSMPPDATNLAEEGVLLRSFKVIDTGEERFDVLRELLAAPPYPSRCPEENVADVVAQIAANKAGVDGLLALVGRCGRHVVDAYMGFVRDAAEAKMRRAISTLPDGVFHRTERLDDGSAICVRVDVRGEGVTVDFAGTAAVLPGNLNATRAIVTSAVLYCFRCLIDEDIALNAGAMAPIELIVPLSFLNPAGRGDPTLCPAVAGGNVETSQRIVDCVFGALGVVAASQGTMNNVVFGSERFAYYETICGGSGAGATFDGADAVHTHMTNTRMTDAEVLEARYPVRLRRFAIRRGSGGRGLHRGGDGCIREIEFLEELDLSLLTQRRDTKPYGLNGGNAGAAGANRLIHAGDESIEQLPAITHIAVRLGDRLIVETPGGGAFGVAHLQSGTEKRDRKSGQRTPP